MQPNQGPQNPNQMYQQPPAPPQPPQSVIQSVQPVQMVTLANEWAYIGFLLSFNPYAALFALIFSILGYKASYKYDNNAGKGWALVGIINACLSILFFLLVGVLILLPLLAASGDN